ncbi:MAG: TonB-dependent receptor, partial [Rhodothermales bacterium]|nr:TonB-dependent receptor [Rhodothermales bacterium]
TPALFGDGEGELGSEQDLGYYFYDFGAKVTLRPAAGHRLSLSYYEGGDALKAEVPFLSLLEPAATAGSVGDPLGLRLGYGWGNRVLSGRYRYLYGRELFVTATGYYSRYAAHETSLARPTATASVDTDYRVRFGEAGLRLDADYYYSLQHQLRIGLRAVVRDFDSRLEEEVIRAADARDVLRQRSTVQAFEAAAYVQDTWQPDARWQVQPGLRVEVFGLGPYVSLNPRLHLRYAVVRERVFLRAGLSRQTQYLHRLRDRYAFTYDLATSRWIPASTDVRPAVAWQAAVGAEAALLPGRALGADRYGRQRYDGRLPADPVQQKDGILGPGIEPGALLEQYVAGAGRQVGLEVAARVERGRWLAGLSYALSRTLERAPGEAYRPARYDAPHALKALVQGGGRRWNVAVAATARSGYPITVPTLRYALGDPLDEAPTPYLHRPALNNGRLPVYFRLDMAVGYAFRLLGLGWDAQVQAYNLLNHRNTVGQRFAADAAAVAAADVEGLPLVPMFNLKAEW